MLPDLSAVPSWAALPVLFLTMIVALARLFVRTVPQTPNARVAWWRELLNYLLKARELKYAERARRHARRRKGGRTDATRGEGTEP